MPRLARHCQRSGTATHSPLGGGWTSLARIDTKGIAHAARCLLRLGTCRRNRVGRYRAGFAEKPVQGDRPEQPDAGVDLRRGSILAEDHHRSLQGRDHRRHHAAGPNGHRRQDHAAAVEARRDGLRRNGYFQDGGRRSALRGLRSGGPDARSRQGARGLRRLSRGDRSADAEKLGREASRLRRQHAAGVLVPRRDLGARRLQGQESARVQQHDARFPQRRRRDGGEHGLRRSGARVEQRGGRLRRDRLALRQHGGLERGDEIHLSDVARLEHQRTRGQSQQVESARSKNAGIPHRTVQGLRRQDVGDGQDHDLGGR